MNRLAIALAILGYAIPASAAEPDAGRPDPAAVERGRVALTTRPFTPAGWTYKGYETVWKQWQPPLKEAPADYDRAFADYYGLHPAPFPNGNLPLGLREGKALLGAKGITNDCMLCHGGSIFGKSYVGLGNASLDIQTFFEDMGTASGAPRKTPFPFSNVRGTTEAGAIAVFFLAYRNPDLSLRLKPVDLDLRSDMCEDVPAWWLLKKKKTMYHTGTAHARSVRSIMQFMLSPANPGSTFFKEEATFNDIQAYLLSLDVPKYPLAIDRDLAARGHKVFSKICSQCHGTYGENASYPNKIVPLDIVGTDKARFEGLSPKFGEHYNQSWFAREKGEEGYKSLEAKGYQAPPLDGVWATAPYFHNGSVPTLEGVLNSKARPKVFTRSFLTGEKDYDAVQVGWKVRVLDEPLGADAPLVERRKVYDTTQRGRGNQGHTFGDDLTIEQRRAVIEYLKTL